MKDLNLDGQATREAYQRLVRDRGPDAGRAVDHLKHAAPGAADRLLALAERGAVPGVDTAELTDADGALLFMLGASRVGGSDVVG